MSLWETVDTENGEIERADSACDVYENERADSACDVCAGEHPYPFKQYGFSQFKLLAEDGQLGLHEIVGTPILTLHEHSTQTRTNM